MADTITTNYSWDIGAHGKDPWWDTWVTLWNAVDTELYTRSKDLFMQGHSIVDGLNITGETNKVIGIQTTKVTLDARNIFTDLSSDYVIGQYIHVDANPSIAPVAQIYGQNIEAYTLAGNAQNFPRMEGSDCYVNHSGSGVLTTAVGGTHTVHALNGNITEAYGAHNKVSNYGNNPITIGNAYGTCNRVANRGGGIITNAYGTYNYIASDLGGGLISNAYSVYITNPAVSAGSITNNYGLYIENQTAGGTLNYSIYSVGGTNYFGGQVLISDGTLGAPSLAFASDPDTGFNHWTSGGIVLVGNGVEIIYFRTDGIQMATNSATLGFGVSTDIILSREATHVLGLDSSLSLAEITAPAGATDKVRIYARDNGAGKTQLMAIFPTGAAQQLAIEA
jgi:hypothetical protein